MMDTVIEVEKLSVAFGRQRVLDDLDLRVERGTVCALLGPNGAGKTTLIKTIVNIYPKRRGAARIFGVPAERLGPAEFRRIGYVSESQELPLWMTVESFLSFCSKMYPTWDHAWAEKMMREMDLDRSREVSLEKLSRGMRVKAALISSLAYHPELLILDEPFSGLDPVVRDEFIAAVIELANATQTTTLISSHDLAEVERIADSIAFLRSGAIIAHRSLDALLTSHKLVTVDLKGGAVANPPPHWLGLSVQDGTAQFVDTQYDSLRTLELLRRQAFAGVVLSAENMSLKEIYRALLGKGV